jgi:subtilisin-like proprotein convertase family protein
LIGRNIPINVKAIFKLALDTTRIRVESKVNNMKRKLSAKRRDGRMFARFHCEELEHRLVPSTIRPKSSMVDLGDIYSSAEYSTQIERYTDRLALGLDRLTAADTLTNLLGPSGSLAGFTVAQTLEQNLFVLSAPPPSASDSAAVQYANLDLRMAEARGISGVDWAVPVFHDPATGNGWMVATSEVIVALQPGISPEQFFVGDSRFVSWRPLSGTHDQFVAISSGVGSETINLANTLNDDPRLAWAQPNFYQSWQRHFVTNDPLVSSHQWHLNNTGQKGGTVDADADVFEAWDVIPGGSSSILISVVDDGMEFTHPDLLPNLFTNPGEIASNGKDDDGNGFIDDVNGWDFTTNGSTGDNNPGASSSVDAHATSVAGVAAGKGDNGIGIAGAAYNSKILPVRIFGDSGSATTDANIAAAVNYAAGRTRNGLGQWTNVHVTNHSWGGGAFSSAIQSAFTWATSKARGGLGTAAFISSGNGYASTVSFPSNLAQTNPGIVSVGASNDEDTKSDYSNFGAGLTLVSPSNDLRSGYYGIVTTDRQGTNGYNTTSGTAGDYTTAPGSEFGGTSSASPLAAGIGALVLALDPTLKATEIRNLLKNTTDYVDIANGAYDAKTGYAAMYGFGRINANTAVRGVGIAEIQVLSGTTNLVDGVSSLNFGNLSLGGSSTRILRIRNQGTETLNLTGVGILGGGFNLLTTPTDLSLDVGETTWFTVEFSPTTAGPNNATLIINSNDTNESNFTIQLTGIGLVANITGSLFEDWNGDGLLDPFDVRIAGKTILFDTNSNGILDSKTVSSGTVNIAIPDNNLTGISSTIAISGFPANVQDVNVTLNITHTYVEDLQIFLTGPSGAKIPLIVNRGGNGQNFTNTTLDDEATFSIASITAAQNPFTGSYRPESALSIFDGTPANGNWTLNILDDFPADVGTLVSWSLSMPSEQTATTSSTGSYGIEGLAVGDYLVTPLLSGFNSVNPSAGTHLVSLASPGDTFNGRDFYVSQQKAFYGLTIDDANKDGIFNTGDSLRPGVTIYIDANGNGKFDTGETTAISDSGGRYQFLSRPTGPATLRQIVTPDRVATLPASGSYAITQVGTESQFNLNFATRVGAPPIITSDGGGATATLIRPENTVGVTTVTSFDPDPGFAPSYSIAGGVDASRFKINSTTGVLNFAVAPNFELPTDTGADNRYEVTVQVSDGIFTATQAISVIVVDVNEAPTFMLGSNPNLLEDAGPQVFPAFASGIQTGPNPEFGQTVTFTVAVAGTTGTMSFAAAPAIDAAGNLTFEASPNVNGTATVTVFAKDDGGVANGGIDTSTMKTFTISVVAVNDAPTFTLGSDQATAEDSGANTAVGFIVTSSVGPSDESKQTIAYIASNDNNLLFTMQPAIAPDGTLTYTIAPDANGIATVSVFAKDSGGTANGGVDTSAMQTFRIVVGEINDAPSFAVGATQSVFEDAAPQTVAAFLTSISPGPASEAAQSVSFLVSNSNPGLFTVAPAIDSSGQLTYTLAPNANGTAKVTVVAQDNGGTANGGVDTSAPLFFTIAVTAVNDAPSFMVGSNQTINEDAGLQSIGSFLSLISAGPTDEAGQTIAFAVSSDNPGLFLIPPTIDANGKLTYFAMPNASGSATVSVIAKDSGGTANGGADASSALSFTVSVNAVNDAPTFVVGPTQNAMGDGGPQTIANFVTAISVGPADESAQSIAFGIIVDNPSLFAVLPTIDASGQLTYTPAPLTNGVAVIDVVGTDDGGTANGGENQSVPRTFQIAITSFLDPVASAAATIEDTITPAPITLDSGLVGSPVTHFRITDIANGLLYRSDGQTFVTNGDFLTVAEATAGLKFLPLANANDATNPGGFGFTIQNATSATMAGLVRTPVAVPVSVIPVNDPPTFTGITPSPLPEDSGLQSIAGFAFNLAAGPASATDEAAQPLSFSVAVVNPTDGLAFDLAPTIDANGTLTFRTAQNSFGTATLRVTLSDGNGGTLVSDVPLVVTPVNDPPTAVVLQPVVPAGGAGPQTVSGVVQFTPGAPNETEPVNVLVQIVETTGNVNFLAPPSIDSAGNLTYTPRRASIGSVKLAISTNDGELAAPTRFVTIQIDSTGRYELVGYPEFGVGTDTGKSNATFFNPDGSVRFFSAAFPGSEFGARVASADFTGDGVAELVIGLGVGTPSAIQVIDGVTQKAIFDFAPFEPSFTGGIFVSAGDVTGDRIADIVISPDEGGGPRVRVLDGATFTVIADFFGIDDPNFRGGARTAIGDLNADGVGDLAVAAGISGGPRVAAFDGLSLGKAPVKLFNDFFAFEQTLRNGVYVAVGDIDGDGISELVVGGGPGGAPRVAAFSGRELLNSGGGSLVLVANFFAGDVESRGGVRVSVKDLDGDRFADLVVGAGTGSGSRVLGYLGPTLIAGPLPFSVFDFEAFDDFVGGVYVG